MHRSNILGSEEACMCPATKESCKEDDECYWYEVRPYPNILCHGHSFNIFYSRCQTVETLRPLPLMLA